MIISKLKYLCILKKQHQRLVYLVGFPAMMLFFVLFLPATGIGQNMPFPPPNQLQVINQRHLSFGSFFTGSIGGTVKIEPDAFGTRTTTGSVQGFYSDPGHSASYVVILIPGRQVSITLQQTVDLTRDGGGMMTMVSGETNHKIPLNTFVTSGGHPFYNYVYVGYTLNVGSSSANPPGSYSGSFTVTFNQD